MSRDNFSICQSLIEQQGDGPTIAASSARTLAIAPQAVFPLDAQFFNRIGKKLRIHAEGKISCPVTTPGTARFDVDLGGVVVFDGMAVPLNIVAKVDVAFWLDIELTCQIVGSAAKLMGAGKFSSEAVVGSPIPSVGGSGLIHLPYNTVPVQGASFNSAVAQVVGLYFKQTVSTAGSSMTVQQYEVVAPN
jgi:hypothetical protein